MRSADRRYFFVVALACALGWTFRLWLLPLVVFALLEGVCSLAARLPHRVSTPARRPVRRVRRAPAARTADRAA